MQSTSHFKEIEHFSFFTTRVLLIVALLLALAQIAFQFNLDLDGKFLWLYIGVACLTWLSTGIYFIIRLKRAKREGIDEEKATKESLKELFMGFFPALIFVFLTFLENFRTFLESLR